MSAVVIVHFAEGCTVPTEYVIAGEDVRVFVVDENAPDDRVYEMTDRAPIERIREMIPDDAEIGSKHDARHPAIEAKVSALLEGRPMLRVVDKGEDR